MSSDYYIASILPYASIIIKICRAYTNTQEDFEDYYQEVCLQIWRSNDEFTNLKNIINMKIDSLQRRKRSEANKKLTKAYNKMQGLIEALDKKDLPSDELIFINRHIGLINSFDGTEKELHKTLKKTYSKTLTFVEEKLKYVTKHHFQKLWMVYGMLAAAVFTSVFSSFEMFGIGSSAGIGFSLGMLTGMMLGANRDKQARKEGRQLEI